MLLERIQVDNDISHAQKAINDEHESRLNAIEAHLGLADDDENAEAADTEDEDTEDGE
jgi:ribosome assembly protein YihI (activator of Der GTPase)